jgi:hypothetical protein
VSIGVAPKGGLGVVEPPPFGQEGGSATPNGQFGGDSLISDDRFGDS